MKKVNGQKRSAYAYNIISGGVVIWQSCCYCYKEDALKHGSEDAMFRNSLCENVYYEVVRTFY